MFWLFWFFFSRSCKSFVRLCIKVEKMFNTTRLSGVLGGQKSSSRTLRPLIVYLEICTSTRIENQKSKKSWWYDDYNRIDYKRKQTEPRSVYQNVATASWEFETSSTISRIVGIDIVPNNRASGCYYREKTNWWELKKVNSRLGRQIIAQQLLYVVKGRPVVASNVAVLALGTVVDLHRYSILLKIN